MQKGKSFLDEVDRDAPAGPPKYKGERRRKKRGLLKRMLSKFSKSSKATRPEATTNTPAVSSVPSNESQSNLSGRKFNAKDLEEIQALSDNAALSAESQTSTRRYGEPLPDGSEQSDANLRIEKPRPWSKKERDKFHQTSFSAAAKVQMWNLDNQKPNVSDSFDRHLNALCETGRIATLQGLGQLDEDRSAPLAKGLVDAANVTKQIDGTMISSGFKNLPRR